MATKYKTEAEYIDNDIGVRLFDMRQKKPGRHPLLEEAEIEITRLRKALADAADEIERLRAEIKRLEAALIHNSEWRDENIRVWAEVERLRKDG